MNKQEILALANRIDGVRAYGSLELQANLRRIDMGEADPNTRVILVTEDHRDVIVMALRELAYDWHK